MGNENDKFEWFGWDEDPKGKYKQPKPNTNPMPTGVDYPITDIDKAGIMVKGRWPAGTGMKKRMDIRGTPIATKGKRMMVEPDKGE